jgi:hypothetical protein
LSNYSLTLIARCHAELVDHWQVAHAVYPDAQANYPARPVQASEVYLTRHQRLKDRALRQADQTNSLIFLLAILKSCLDS